MRDSGVPFYVPNYIPINLKDLWGIITRQNIRKTKVGFCWVFDAFYCVISKRYRIVEEM